MLIKSGEKCDFITVLSIILCHIVVWIAIIWFIYDHLKYSHKVKKHEKEYQEELKANT
jgi:heme/copper-type cytochrome/quinol oxidase subunit 2